MSNGFESADLTEEQKQMQAEKAAEKRAARPLSDKEKEELHQIAQDLATDIGEESAVKRTSQVRTAKVGNFFRKVENKSASELMYLKDEAHKKVKDPKERAKTKKFLKALLKAPVEVRKEVEKTKKQLGFETSKKKKDGRPPKPKGGRWKWSDWDQKWVKLTKDDLSIFE